MLFSYVAFFNKMRNNDIMQASAIVAVIAFQSGSVWRTHSRARRISPSVSNRPFYILFTVERVQVRSSYFMTAATTIETDGQSVLIIIIVVKNIILVNKNVSQTTI